MKILNILLISSICITLFGCASGANKENMIYQGGNKNYDSHLKNEVAVSPVFGAGGEETNPAWTSEISKYEFSGAIRESLKKKAF